jgi:D-xylose 1-dehydrogenase (NADP+, D-xylono-1,5-lactone-forming)
MGSMPSPDVMADADLKNESRLVNWGVLGVARVAEKVMVPGIQRSGNGMVHAVASRTPEKAVEFAQRVGARVAYGSYEELLRDDLVQAVYIALPNSLHKEWTVRAAEAGKHVLCEKPMATRYADAVEMVDACRRNGVVLMEAFAHRFHPQNVAVKCIVDEDGIGEPTGFVAVHSSSPPQQGDIRLSKELDGGVLADKGCYCVNTARLMLGTEPTSIFARGDIWMMTGSTRGSPSNSASPEGASPSSTRGSSWPVTPTIRAIPFWASTQGSGFLRGSPRERPTERGS